MSTAVVELSHDYASAPDKVWKLATDFTALAEVCKPLVTFSGLPEGRTHKGMTVHVKVRLLGILPPQPYAMEVVDQDDHHMWLLSSEKGAGVKSWHHRMQVEPHGSGARLTDRIEIDAGWMTPVFAWWARKLYAHRHRPRQRLLGEAPDA